MIELFVDHFSRMPDGTDCGFSVWSWGRAIARISKDATAFTGLTAAFWMAAQAT